jgi:hypothetical protein
MIDLVRLSLSLVRQPFAEPQQECSAIARNQPLISDTISCCMVRFLGLALALGDCPKDDEGSGDPTAGRRGARFYGLRSTAAR